MNINLNQPIHVATYTVTTSVQDVVDTLQACGVDVNEKDVSAQLVNDFVNMTKSIHDDAIETIGCNNAYSNCLRSVAKINGFLSEGS